MKNQDAPPAVESKDEKLKSDKKEEIQDNNEIIFETSKKETQEENELKLEMSKEKLNDNDEIIIKEPKKEVEKNEIKTGDHNKEIEPKKKDRLQMDEFEKFMDKYPENLIGKFEFNFYGDTLKPDCVFWRDGRKYYVYFNLNYLRNKLDEKWVKIFKQYPKNLKYLIKPLEEYRKQFREQLFKSDRGYLKNFHKEYYLLQELKNIV